jgi:hypothetical protein
VVLARGLYCTDDHFNVALIHTVHFPTGVLERRDSNQYANNMISHCEQCKHINRAREGNDGQGTEVRASLSLVGHKGH